MRFCVSFSALMYTPCECTGDVESIFRVASPRVKYPEGGPVRWSVRTQLYSGVHIAFLASFPSHRSHTMTHDFYSTFTWRGTSVAADVRMKGHKVRDLCIALYPSQSASWYPDRPLLLSYRYRTLSRFHSRGASFSLSYHSFFSPFSLLSVRTPQRAVRRRCKTCPQLIVIFI